MDRFRKLGVFLGFFLALNAAATDAVPLCKAAGKNIPVNNSQVIQWKSTTQNQFLGRGHVQGRLTGVYPDRNNHAHFQIELSPAETLEVVFSYDFGKLPKLALGMDVEACGDYITSNAPTSQYPASPDGAIIHWIHKNPKNGGHESGYLVLDGSVYGN